MLFRSLLERIGYQGLLTAIGQEWKLTTDQNVKARYENDKTGQRIATGIAGAATGEGADFLICDDLHKLEEWDSEPKRSAAVEWVTEVAPSRLNNAETSAMVVIMQRVHQQDVTGALIKQGDFEHICLPCEYEPKHPFVWPDDPRKEEGELLWPGLNGPEKIEKFKQVGSFKYAGLYQQRPAPAQGAIFQRDWWRFWSEQSVNGSIARPHKWEMVFQSWDLTFGGDDGTSYVVGQVWARSGADFYLLDQVRDKMPFNRQLQAVRNLCTKWPEVKAILVEDAAAGRPLMQTLKREIPGIIGVKPEGGKTERAASISPYVEAGNVYLPAGASFTADFVEECSTFPGGYDD